MTAGEARREPGSAVLGAGEEQGTRSLGKTSLVTLKKIMS